MQLFGISHTSKKEWINATFGRDGKLFKGKWHFGFRSFGFQLHYDQIDN